MMFANLKDNFATEESQFVVKPLKYKGSDIHTQSYLYNTNEGPRQPTAVNEGWEKHLPSSYCQVKLKLRTCSWV